MLHVGDGPSRIPNRRFAPGYRVWCAIILPVLAFPARASSATDPKHLEFFEKEVRPLLVEHCYECHSAGAEKLKGGLYLDSREGWMKGGDTGPALVPGQPDRSLLIEAVRYGNADLEMPPKNKLADRHIAILEKWVSVGAPDPREEPVVPQAKRSGMTVEEGRQFWCYRPITKPEPPPVGDTSWPRSPIDRFILAPLESQGLAPADDANAATMVRRLHFDLTGLPPTIEQLDAFASPDAFLSPSSLSELADHLLASPRFGERWGRHWLDVVRFGESVTLRGFVFPEAWRYRDYVIEAFNLDVPYGQFVREQIAGDLLPASSVADEQRLRVATTFLALGNLNYEEQDKKQLDMDVVDEQLDVIGKAFLAQTIACARCHDHKFDPIPTRDYYAMAGILKGMQVLEHANVSKWVEVPLPLPAEEEEFHREKETEMASLNEKIQQAKEALAALKEPDGGASPDRPAILGTNDFPGLVLDDAEARKVGEWKFSQWTRRYIEDGYTHDLDEAKGEKTATFQPHFPEAGRYEVRFAYTPGSNRAPNVPVTVFSADGETTVMVDQTKPPPIEGRFVSLGTHRFETNDQGFVMVSNEGTRGHVTVDAMQFLKEDAGGAKLVADEPEAPAAPDAEREERVREEKRLHASLQELEKALAKLKDVSSARPMVMTIKEDPAGDIPVHVRGSVHSLGDVVPRGFLQVAMTGDAPDIPEDRSGRRELADWLASSDNPLTARVMVNRVWHWLMGKGLVRTTDNFGTTGSHPTHPELLDWLAVRFMEEGWSVKWLVREIVTSRVYALSSTAPSLTARDPENHWRGRMDRRRLEAECIRDAMLAVSGRLDLTMGGPTFAEGQTADYGQEFNEPRRSVYVPVLRNSLPELFEVFDFADPSMVTGQRNVSTVAPQALYMLNHPFARRQAEGAAQRLLAETSDETRRVGLAYRRTLGREPSAAERALAGKHLSRAREAGAAELEAWTELMQALFGSVDFRYLN